MREGSRPNGRDGMRQHGATPESPAALTPTRPYASNIRTEPAFAIASKSKIDGADMKLLAD